MPRDHWRQRSDSAARRLRTAQLNRTAGEGIAATPRSIQRICVNSRREDSTLPDKYPWLTRRLKFFSFEPFYIIACADAESYRVQRGSPRKRRGLRTGLARFGIYERVASLRRIGSLRGLVK